MSIWCHRFDQNSNKNIVRISALKVFIAWGFTFKMINFFFLFLAAPWGKKDQGWGDKMHSWGEIEPIVTQWGDCRGNDPSAHQAQDESAIHCGVLGRIMKKYK